MDLLIVKYGSKTEEQYGLVLHMSVGYCHSVIDITSKPGDFSLKSDSHQIQQIPTF